VSRNRRTAWVLVVIAVAQAVAGLFVVLFGDLGTAFLAMYLMAYTLGMRHAFDADHIAAIDNVSRSMLSRGEHPTSVGLFFALGHSAVVSIVTFLVGAGASRLQGTVSHLQGVVASLSSILAASILFYMVPRNLRIAWRIVHNRKSSTHPIANAAGGGVVSRLLARFLTAKLRGWHMLLIGALFGLGFETATALSMIALVGAQSARGLHVLSLAIFPLLFTAGMVLVDSLDGLLMERAYGWALRRPDRHLIYNFSVTLVSALLALIIGFVELAASVKQFVVIHGVLVVDFVESHTDGIGAAVIIGFAGAYAYAFASLRPARQCQSPEKI
jgi:nickel/cobalt transporter (NiCoT) family protein